jgi:hypothetical protein
MQGEVRPEPTADTSAALVVPHVQISLEARYSIPSLSLHGFAKAYLFTESSGTSPPKCSYLSTEKLVVYGEVLIPLYRNVGTPVLKLWYLSTKHLNNYVSQYRKAKINKLALNKNVKAFRTRSASLVNLKHGKINLICV